jgi:DNA (cytosine-5)-methyltransferase 1
MPAPRSSQPRKSAANSPAGDPSSVGAFNKLRVLDLFAGIGGFSLGLERTGGFETVAFCEIEPFPRAVLAKHWPGVPQYDDVRELTGARLAADGIAVDCITGGFPCQDISVAGKQAGIADGTRSGLWSEIARLVGEIRPRVVIVENVAALLSGPSERPGGWFGRVLGDLAALGYDVRWDCIPASAVGAPHQRDRAWIVAYAASKRRGEAWQHSERPAQWASGRCEVLADAESIGRGQRRTGRSDSRGADGLAERPEVMADADGDDIDGRRGDVQMGRLRLPRQTAADGDAGRTQRRAQSDVGRSADGLPARLDGRIADAWAGDWEAGIPRVLTGVSDRVARLKALGNAVVPQVVEYIGHSILSEIGADPSRNPACGADPVAGVYAARHQPLTNDGAK